MQNFVWLSQRVEDINNGGAYLNDLTFEAQNNDTNYAERVEWIFFHIGI